MQAIRVSEPNNPKLEEVEKPGVEPNKVLIKVCYSPINPSNNMQIEAKIEEWVLPYNIGIEGSGVIIEIGENCPSNLMVGMRVSFFSYGCWSEYCLADPNFVFPIPEGTTLIEGASFFVNPLTVCGFCDLLKKKGSTSFVHTVGGGVVGKMFISYCKQIGIKVISLVRNETNLQNLNEFGSEFTLNMEDPQFEIKLKDICGSLETVDSLDGVGGELTYKVLLAMPKNSTIYLYGSLSGWKLESDIRDLIFKGKNITGYQVAAYLEKLSIEEVYEIIQSTMSKLNTIFKINYELFDFKNFIQAIEHSKTKASISKALLVFDKSFD